MISVGSIRPAYIGAAIVFAAQSLWSAPAFAQDNSGPGPWGAFNLEQPRDEPTESELQSYREQSQKGKLGATWKLGRVFSLGQGVERDDYEAYKYFLAVVSQGAEAGSRDETFIGDAYAELGRYTAVGIPGTPVEANPELAQDYFARAANYHSAIGQYELGRWYLRQSQAAPGNLTLAAMWLKAAARKGHQGARAMLGNILFQQGKVVEGLAQMTVALERAPDIDRNWIRPLQEEAFALADDVSRKAAIKRADTLLGQK